MILINWQGLFASALRFALVLMLGHIVIRVGASVIDRAVKGGYAGRGEPRRLNTIAALLKSVLRYAVNFAVVMSLLDLAGIQTASVLAGAGIIGLAVGFGAQNLVKDVISGFFLLLEDQFSVGELVTIANVTGTVEEIGLRTTRIKAASGEIHTIPNGAIDRSANMSRASMLAIVDVPVPADEKIAVVSDVLARVASSVGKGDASITQGPDLLGPVAIAGTGVTYRITARTVPGSQWATERKIRAAVKQAFEEEGISLPSFHIVQKE